MSELFYGLLQVFGLLTAIGIVVFIAIAGIYCSIKLSRWFDEHL